MTTNVYVEDPIGAVVDHLRDREPHLPPVLGPGPGAGEPGRDQRQTLERYRSLVFELLPEAALIVDECGKALDVNPRLQQWLGYSAGELLGIAIPRWPFLPAESATTIMRNFSRCLSGADVPPYEIEFCCKSGGVRIGRIATSLITHPDGSPCGSLVVMSDVTEQRNADRERIAQEEQSLQARKLEPIGQLAGGVAHDFNNILGAIVGYAEAVKTRATENPKLTYYADRIIEAGFRAADHAGRLLSFARKAPMETARVDVHECIRRTVDMLRHTIDKRIEIETSLDAEESHVQGNGALIENSLLNLGINARDAMPGGGKLSFATDVGVIDAETGVPQPLSVGRYLRILVTDTGTGMNSDVLQRLYEPFFTTKVKGKGTGLGLAGVYGMVTQHKGRISVRSAEGMGTTIELLLPLASHERSATATGQTGESIRGNGGILLVDDEDDIRGCITEMLEHLGYHVVAKADGREAVDFYEHNRGLVDLVLLDLVMPGASGLDCLKSFKRIDPGVRVVVLSGNVVGDEAASIMEAGALALLAKPVGLAALSRAVAAAVERGGGVME